MSEMNEPQTTEQKLTPAEKYYRNHVKRVAEYQKANPEKVRIKQQKYNAKVKADPEKYEAMMQKKRAYYYNVRKPKLAAKKAAEAAEIAELNNTV
jgi:hypothetical protein